MGRKLVGWEDFEFKITENGMTLEFTEPEWEELERERDKHGDIQ